MGKSGTSTTHRYQGPYPRLTRTEYAFVASQLSQLKMVDPEQEALRAGIVEKIRMSELAHRKFREPHD